MSTVTPGQWSLVDVLGRLRIELEGGEDHDRGLGHQPAGLLQRRFHLALLQRRVLGAEGHEYTARLVLLRFRVGMQPAGAGQRLDAGEVDHLFALGADAGAQQFPAPFMLPQGLTGTGDGFIAGHGGRVVTGEFFRRLHHRRRDGLDGERASDAGLGVVDQRLVIEGFLSRRLVIGDVL